MAEQATVSKAATKWAAQSTRFLSAVDIKYQPRDLFSRFFLAADARLEQLELRLDKCSFAELRRVHEVNIRTWPILVPFFDVTAGAIPDDQAACFVGYDRHGDAVTTTAVRVWDLGDGTLLDEMQTLSWLFGAGAQHATMLSCEVPAIAAKMTGSMLYCGAYWVRPDWRGSGLGHVVPAMSRFYALARWPAAYKITFGSQKFLAPELRHLYQYENFEDGFKLRNGTQTIFDGMILWARRSFMVDQLDDLTRSLRAAVDSGQHQ